MSYLNEKPFQFWLVLVATFIGFLWLFNGILMPFVVGMAIAYLLNPMVEKMARKGFPRWLAALLILSAFVLTAALGLLIAVPVLIREMADFIALIPSLIDRARLWVGETLPMVDIPQILADFDPAVLSNKAGDIFNVGRNILGNVLQGGAALIGFISFLVLIPIIAFYLMIDWPGFIARVRDLVPEKNRETVTAIMSDIDRSLSGFIRGQLTVCFLLGLFYAIGLSLVGLQYGFFIGVAAGVLSIIPYVGSLFGLVASVGMAFYQFGGWQMPLVAFAIFAIGQFVEGNYLTPKLVGGSVGLHPLWVIFVLMAGGTLLGLLGMMIAVPVAAVIGVLVRHFIGRYKRSGYYKGV